MAILYHIKRKGMSIDGGYIGVTRHNVFKRLNEHKRGTNPHLTNAMRKYNDIEIKVLVIGELNYCLLLEELLRPCENMGWNIAKGGGLPPISKPGMHSDEFKRKLIERNRTLSSRPEQRKRLSKLHKGKVIPDWHRKILSEANKNKIVSEETRLKISNALKGIKRRTIQCVHCGKVGVVSNINRWHNDNCKKRVK